MSGSKLKWIAIVTMLIDHIGAALVEYYLRIHNWSGTAANSYQTYLALDMVLRSIGRLAFPIFIFLLVEGFFYTKNRSRYLLRLTLFAFVSDIPFDLALFLSNAQVRGGTFLSFAHQNVFFTLAIGFAGMWILEKLRKLTLGKAVFFLGSALVIAGLGLIAESLHTDYGMGGVAAILAAYLARRYLVMPGKLPKQAEMWITVLVLVIMSSLIEAFALLDVPLVRMYDGSRGKTVSKWFFYIFYPAHLLVLFLIRYLIW